jgi:mevalonate kinase
MTVQEFIMDKSFSSKVLLFGEYSVIKDSMALSLPYSLFEGKLIFRKERGQGNDPELKALGSYLQDLESSGELGFEFDVSSFQFDIGQGLIFDSTIPQGFGVGSSGALVAALYDRYGTSVEKNTESPSELKKRLALIESHFHGSSSGMDPLISYLNRPILKKEKGKIGPVFLPKWEEGEGAIFLINTGRSRKTEPLVNLFLEKCKVDEFDRMCIDELLPATNSCIHDFLEGQTEELFFNFEKLSRLQLQHFSPMIPKLFLSLWKEGLESNKFFLKLCGAGGGGFLLGMTKNIKESNRFLQDFEVRRLFRF